MDASLLRLKPEKIWIIEKSLGVDYMKCNNENEIVKEFVTINELINHTAEKWGEKEAFSYKNDNREKESVSYVEFQREIYAMAEELQKKKYINFKIGILGDNNYNWILSYFGIVCSGNIAVPIDKNLGADEIARLINDCNLDNLYFSDDYIDIINLIKNDSHCKRVTFTDMNLACSMVRGCIVNGSELAEADKDLLAMIVYTSGTTGLPKGVMLTHGNIMADTYGTALNVHSKEVSKSVLVLPLHHMFSIIAGLTTIMLFGISIYINTSYKYLVSNLKEVRPEYIAMVPLMLENIYSSIINKAKKNKQYLKLKTFMVLSESCRVIGLDIRKWTFGSIRKEFGSCLKVVTCGGASLDKKYISAFREWSVQIVVGYGMTECSPIIAVNCIDNFRDGSVGTPLCCCEVKIDKNPDEDCGEILVRGRNVTKGYYNRVEETKNLFDGKWLRTGDIGYLDKDSFLFITGRKKNLIILSNGENISPEELESKIKKIPYVVDALVYAKNGLITAEIVLDIENYVNSEQKINSEIRNINKEMPMYKNINKVIIKREDFERTSISKVRRP